MENQEKSTGLEDWGIYFVRDELKWDTPSGPTPGPYTVVEPGPNALGQHCPEYDIIAPSRDPSRWTAEVIARVVPAGQGNGCLPLEVVATAKLLASSWTMREQLARCLKILKDEEWDGFEGYGESFYDTCTVCYGISPRYGDEVGGFGGKYYRTGHRNGCAKAALIAELENMNTNG